MRTAMQQIVQEVLKKARPAMLSGQHGVKHCSEARTASTASR